MTMTIKDAYGNVATVSGAKSLTLTGNQAGSFYGTAGCGAGTISSITVANAQSQATFYYKNNTAQTVTLAADSGGFGQGNLVFAVNPGTADTLAMTGVGPLSAGACSASAITMTTRCSLETRLDGRWQQVTHLVRRGIGKFLRNGRMWRGYDLVSYRSQHTVSDDILLQKQHVADRDVGGEFRWLYSRQSGVCGRSGRGRHVGDDGRRSFDGWHLLSVCDDDDDQRCIWQRLRGEWK